MKPDQMTSKERIIAGLHNRPVDHIPFSPFLAYVWESFSPEIQEAGQLEFHHAIGADPMWRGAACPVKAILPEGMERKVVQEKDREVTYVTTPVGGFNFAHAKSTDAGNTTFCIDHPLKTEEDYKVRMWIEENIRYERNYEAVTNHLNGQGREGLSVGQLIPRCKSAYQDMVEFFVGTEELIYAQMDFPYTVKSLWEIMVANDLEAVKLSLDSEYDYFLTYEDSSTQNYSPDQYDEFIGSEIGQWCDMLKGAGKYYVQHACGHVAALTERMRDHGVKSINSCNCILLGLKWICFYNVAQAFYPHHFSRRNAWRARLSEFTKRL